MGTIILLRHGRSTANGQHILAGRTPGVALDATGQRQADDLPQRLAGQPITAIVSSPLDRCLATVAPLAGLLGIETVVDERIVEVNYGGWSGRALDELRAEPAWRTVQEQPSAMVFPDGESMAAVSARAVAAAREHATAADDHVVVLCSHGDVIAMILADALGMHLDQFQRIVVAPASISVVHYAQRRPMVLGINNLGVLPAPPPRVGNPDPTAGSAAVSVDSVAAGANGTSTGAAGGAAAARDVMDDVLGGVPGV